jgi:hypothetical protein
LNAPRASGRTTISRRALRVAFRPFTIIVFPVVA